MKQSGKVTVPKATHLHETLKKYKADLAEANTKIATLTEQLRLANEDAERLYAELEFAYDGEDVDTDTALRLHKERIQESE